MVAVSFRWLSYLTTLVVASTAAVATASSPASSSSTGINLAVDRFDPSQPGDPFFGVDAPDVAGGLRLSAELLGNYAHDPVMLYAVSNNQALTPLVQSQAFLYASLALSLWNRVSASVLLPVALYQSGPTVTVGSTVLTAPSGAQVGDTRIGVRVALVDVGERAFQLGLGGFLYLPLGSSSSPSGAYVSDGSYRGRLEAIVGGEAGRFFWTLAVGPDIRRSQAYLSVDQGTMLDLKAGMGLALLPDDQLQIGPEFDGALTLQDVNAYTDNAELLFGARYYFRDREFHVGLGAGPGLTQGIGTPDLRALVSLGFSPPDFKRARPPAPAPEPVAEEAPPPEPTPEPKVAPPPAPAPQPEVKAEPPPAPKAEVKAEPPPAPAPKPEPPPAPEPKPEPAPAPIEEVKPVEAPKPVVKVVGSQVVLLDQIRFAFGTSTILPESEKILEAVLAAIQKLPATDHFRVEGHTDDRGSAELNKALSLARAKAAVQWLVEHGMEANRFDTAGFGPDRPIASNATSAGRQKNRRTEFHIIEQDNSGSAP